MMPCFQGSGANDDLPLSLIFHRGGEKMRDNLAVTRSSDLVTNTEDTGHGLMSAPGLRHLGPDTECGGGPGVTGHWSLTG